MIKGGRAEMMGSWKALEAGKRWKAGKGRKPGNIEIKKRPSFW
jgi:hypothetical protein